MARLVVVSNRVVELGKAAQAGGVAVLLADVIRNNGGLWFGWNGRVVEAGDQSLRASAKPARKQSRSAIATIALTNDEHRDFYLGYSNSVLWPVFHNRLDLARFDAHFYDRYRAVNKRFASELAPLLDAGDLIWIHDYHLIPLAAELRELGVDNPMGFFLHIPVPPAQTFLAIPEHRELAKALSSYDIIGLQTRADVANLIGFLKDGIAGRILQDGSISVLDRRVVIKSFPVGINLADFVDDGQGSTSASASELPYRIIGVDRLDYTKGLPQKFAAFGCFLEKHSRYRGKVILSQIAPPTRESVEAYADIRSALESLSGKINGMFSEHDWVPIHYIHRPVPRKRLPEVYRSARVGMFTPLRDGMNLVAKEYVAAQDPNDPGVLILSRFAGSAEQLEGAVVVNPYNIEEMAEAIRVALEMEKPERVERHRRLFSTIKAHDTFAWSQEFLADLIKQGETGRMARMTSPSVHSALERLKRVI